MARTGKNSTKSESSLSFQLCRTIASLWRSIPAREIKLYSLSLMG